MSDDSPRPAATTDDVSPPVATSSDSEYSLSIEDALALYEAAGVPRTRRSIQRYCARGDLDAHRIETESGEKFLITSASVNRHISYILEVRPDATGHDLSRHVATEGVLENAHEPAPAVPATRDDSQRPAATTDDVSPPVSADGLVIELLKGENQFLREQIKVKDQQIAEQSERSRETNVLIGGLQRLLTPLLSRPGAARPDADQGGGDA